MTTWFPVLAAAVFLGLVLRDVRTHGVGGCLVYAGTWLVPGGIAMLTGMDDVSPEDFRVLLPQLWLLTCAAFLGHPADGIYLTLRHEPEPPLPRRMRWTLGPAQWVVVVGIVALLLVHLWRTDEFADW